MHKQDMIPFGWTRTTVDDGTELPIPSMANAVLVVNIGTTLAIVDGLPINPRLVPGTNGESHTIGGHIGEIIDMPGLEITFPNGPGLVFVRFKIYKSSC